MVRCQLLVQVMYEHLVPVLVTVLWNSSSKRRRKKASFNDHRNMTCLDTGVKSNTYINSQSVFRRRLTCFTRGAHVLGCTGARESIHPVHTASSIQAWVGLAIVNICKLKSYFDDDDFMTTEKSSLVFVTQKYNDWMRINMRKLT